MLAARLFHGVGLHGSFFCAARAEEWLRSVVKRVYWGFCAMRGHDLRLRFEPRRLSLRCADCGWESPGWVLDRRFDSRATFAISASKRISGRSLNRFERKVEPPRSSRRSLHLWQLSPHHRG